MSHNLTWIWIKPGLFHQKLRTFWIFMRPCLFSRASAVWRGLMFWFKKMSWQVVGWMLCCVCFRRVVGFVSTRNELGSLARFTRNKERFIFLSSQNTVVMVVPHGPGADWELHTHYWISSLWCFTRVLLSTVGSFRGGLRRMWLTPSPWTIENVLLFYISKYIIYVYLFNNLKHCKCRNK